MTGAPHNHVDDNDFTPSDYKQLEPFSEELRRLALDIDNAIRKRAPLPRCLSGIVAMRPLINLIEESAIKLLSGSDGDLRADIDQPAPSETESADSDELIPGYL